VTIGLIHRKIIFILQISNSIICSVAIFMERFVTDKNSFSFSLSTTLQIIETVYLPAVNTMFLSRALKTDVPFLLNSDIVLFIFFATVFSRSAGNFVWNKISRSKVTPFTYFSRSTLEKMKNTIYKFERSSVHLNTVTFKIEH